MKPTVRLKNSLKEFKKYLMHILCSVLMLASFQTQAYKCDYSPFFHDNLTIPVIGSGMSTVGEDVPVGQVLYSTTFLRAVREISRTCQEEPNDDMATLPKVNLYSMVEAISMPAGTPITQNDKSIFPTNVPGVGVSFDLNVLPVNGSKFPAYWEKDVLPGSFSEAIKPLTIVRLNIIKTGKISPGTHQILGSSFPTFQIIVGSKYPYVFEQPFVTLSFSGATTMYTKTCQLATSVVDVNLGTHQRSDFTGVGSTGPWESFDILLKDCPAFVGYGTYLYDEDKQLTFGSNTENQVGITFNSIHGVVANNPLLANLESGPDSATGIGIELAERNSANSLKLDGTASFPLKNLPTIDGSDYVIPLKARYVQYEDSVKAGKANGAAVFTITYQ